MRHWTKWMALVLCLIAAGLIVKGQPSFETRWRRMETKYKPMLDSRSILIDPGELLQLLYDHGITLTILDVRSERDFNLFHLADAVRGDIDDLERFHWSELPSNAVVVVMSNGETDAVEAWKRLKLLHVTNAYVLEGGANGWLAAFGNPAEVVKREVIDTGGGSGDEVLAYRFTAALGGRHAVSRPDVKLEGTRVFEKKVKTQSQARKSGGCG